MKIIFLGVQGSGKSTQAQQLARKLNVPYIEMGQLLRDKTRDTDEQANKIKSALDVGDLVSNQITISILRKRLSQPDCQSGFILDGYPRNQEQLEKLPNEIDQVFYVKISDEEAIKRLLARARHDDNRKSIERRIELYHQQTEPLLDYFKNQGVLTEIDGRPPIKDVYKEIIARLNEPDKN